MTASVVGMDVTIHVHKDAEVEELKMTIDDFWLYVFIIQF